MQDVSKEGFYANIAAFESISLHRMSDYGLKI